MTAAVWCKMKMSPDAHSEFQHQAQENFQKQTIKSRATETPSRIDPLTLKSSLLRSILRKSSRICATTSAFPPPGVTPNIRMSAKKVFKRINSKAPICLRFALTVSVLRNLYETISENPWHLVISITATMVF